MFVFLPEHHHYPVDSSHLHVRGGNGVLLPLLCRLLVLPLPVSVQEETHPGQEGKTTPAGSAPLLRLSLVKEAVYSTNTQHEKTLYFSRDSMEKNILQ